MTGIDDPQVLPEDRPAGDQAVSSPVRSPAVLHADFHQRMEDIHKKGISTTYCDFDNKGNVVLVICKRCGTVIRQMVPDPGGGKRLAVFANYVEINIPCDDGSMHISPCCVDCAGRLSKNDLNMFLDIDANQMLLEAASHGTPITEGFLRVLLERRAK
jgi:hypothetical protein